ncbi:MAG: asparaginase [Candidatus Kerfeldbacteria bacterium]|nr:asparaginase [Candidatus Kerfeldbacteria bacterium]
MRRRNLLKTARFSKEVAKLPRKRVALLFSGGTMLSEKPRPWEIVKKPEHMRRWLDNMSEINVIADVEPVFITGKGTLEIGPDEWLAMAEAVRRLHQSVDGFVVLHGVETLHYTANALSLMLRNLPFPAVVSGSPLRMPGLGVRQVEFAARANIINAVQVAAADVAGVCVVFGNRIMPAAQVQPVMAEGAFQLVTAETALLGRVDFGTKLFENRTKRSNRKPRWSIHLDQHVFVTTITPAVSASSFRLAIRGDFHAILARLHELVSLPDYVEREFRRALKHGIPVVLSSRHPLPGMVEFISLLGVSPSMAVVKTMWALGATREAGKLRKLLEQNVAGEFIQGGAA